VSSNNKTIISADRTLLLLGIIFYVIFKLQDKILILIGQHEHNITSAKDNVFTSHTYVRRFTEVYETVRFLTVCLAVAELI
jgi:hypothetical protein